LSGAVLSERQCDVTAVILGFSFVMILVDKHQIFWGIFGGAQLSLFTVAGLTTFGGISATASALPFCRCSLYIGVLLPWTHWIEPLVASLEPPSIGFCLMISYLASCAIS